MANTAVCVQSEAVTELRIGSTTYIVKSNFDTAAKEAILSSVRRLIRKEATKTG